MGSGTLAGDTNEIGNNFHYYPYRAFCGQNKIVYSTCFVTRRAISYKYYPGNIIDIARALCDQSFNIDLRLRYVVRIHSTENRTMLRRQLPTIVR